MIMLGLREGKFKKPPWSARWETSVVASRCTRLVEEENRHTQPLHPRMQLVRPWDWQRQIEGMEVAGVKFVEWWSAPPGLQMVRKVGDPWGSDGVGPVFCHKQITERQVSGKTEGLLVMQNCGGDRSRCVAWWGIQSRVVWRCVNQSSFLRRSWSWELYLQRSRSWGFYLRRSRSWETQGNRTHTQEDRWRGFWETTVQVSSSNERKVSQVLFRVVNRRPDDKCQRACGIYGCAD